MHPLIKLYEHITAKRGEAAANLEILRIYELLNTAGGAEIDKETGEVIDKTNFQQYFNIQQMKNNLPAGFAPLSESEEQAMNNNNKRVDWDTHKRFIGSYQETRTINQKQGDPFKVHVFKDQDGEMWDIKDNVNISKFVTLPSVAGGALVCIDYLGTEVNGKKTYKKFNFAISNK